MPHTAGWRDLNERIITETERIWKEEPDEMKVMRLGLHPNKAGSKGQYWTTIDFANGMMRDFPMYTMYPILQLVRGGTFSLNQAKVMVRAFHPPYTEYLGYSGYTTLRAFGREFIAALDDFEDINVFVQCYTNLLKYCNKLGAWSYHYFPWEISELYPQRNAEWIATIARLADAGQGS